MLPDRRFARRAGVAVERAAAGEPLALACVVGCAAALLVSCAPPTGPAPNVASAEPPSPGAEPSPNALVAEPETAAGTRESSPSGAAAPTSSDVAADRVAGEPVVLRAPDGYVEMTVVGVAPTEDGDAVLLVDEARSVIVPIFVGNTEALAIELRHRKERFARPLTHDLLDSVMRELGGVLVKVQVDDIKGKTFVGSVFIRTGGRVIELDARPSDAIALALGGHVPIFVARRVMREGGIRKDEKKVPGYPADVPHI